MKLDVEHFERYINTIEKAYELLKQTDKSEIYFDLYRSACVKEFELILEQSGKLLRKILKPYFDSTLAVDRLTFKDVFRNAVLRGIISDTECERWLKYRDVRNSSAHDYGANFAEEIVTILESLIKDAKSIVGSVQKENYRDVD
jgi:nucleotidyltransferase substrate binding protein (TIGR01987 family)